MQKKNFFIFYFFPSAILTLSSTAKLLKSFPKERKTNNSDIKFQIHELRHRRFDVRTFRERICALNADRKGFLELKILVGNFPAVLKF